MKYVELKNSLKSNIFNNYLLSGSDEFLLNKSVELIFNALKIGIADLNFQKFLGESVDFDDVVKALNTMPVFDDKKLVAVYLHIKTSVSNLPKLTEYLKNPNPQSVLVVVAGDNNDLKAQLNKFEVVDCNRLSEDIVDKFVLSELKATSTNITKPALKTLNEYCVYDLSKIVKEVSKLVSFVADKKLIEEGDVKLLVNKTLEFQIFELTENLAKKNKDKVFEILEALKAKKDVYRTLVPLIYAHFRRLFYVAVSNLSKSELGTMLGVKDYAITVAYKQSKMFTKVQLKNIINIMEQLDFELKTSAISNDLAVDYLVLKILNSK
ncbi:MAG: DNA polymerase III subunit delta [Clostridia bacterium]|nr:DNA polymerase III subunit delta [Clostridia bacterium]